MPRFALTDRAAQEIAAKMEFGWQWACACGAQLRIRSRIDHRHGPSNYEVFPGGHARAGHATVPPHALTWAGMAAERGWVPMDDDVAQCPACRAGLSLSDYKAAKRAGGAAPAATILQG